MQQLVRRPIPAPSPITQPFWDATRERRIAIQRCNACSTFHHPPAPQCNHCRSVDLHWVDVAGTGSINEFTVVRQSRVQGMEESEPYACIAVELDEQPNLLLIGNLVNATWQEAKIGLRVEAVFEDIGDGYVLPQFQPAGRR